MSDTEAIDLDRRMKVPPVSDPLLRAYLADELSGDLLKVASFFVEHSAAWRGRFEELVVEKLNGVRSEVKPSIPQSLTRKAP